MLKSEFPGEADEEEDEYGEGGADEMGEAGEEGEEEEEEGTKDDEEEEPPPPPLPEEEKELIFLIEFMVDTLEINRKNLKIENIDPCHLSGPASVTLCFLHFPPMIINEKDTDPDRFTGSDEVHFNSGKSLMFALTESQFEQPPPVFLGVKAAREMPHAFRFASLPIGKTKVQLSELFKQVFEKYDEFPQKTVSKSIKDKYELKDERGKTTAEVSIYIRLTCLGENIVTEFQYGEGPNEALMFKSKESKKVYECKETDLVDDSSTGQVVPGYGKESKTCEMQKYFRPPDPEDENFEEIFAEINGSAITIQVEKSKRKDPPREFHISDFCDCNIPLPQNLVAGMSDLSLNQVSEGSVSLATGTPIQTDKKVGLTAGNQIVFDVPPTETLAQPGLHNTVTYNVKTCQEGEKHGHRGKGSFRVVAENNTDGNPPKMPNDSDRDVFILRIIKKGRGREKGKNNLELELKIPKEKIEPPKRPPYMVDRQIGQEKPKKGKKKKKKRK